MDELKLALQFVIKKELDIILENISTDYNIPLEQLHKYTDKKSIEIKNDTNIVEFCQALTKKNGICGNKIKSGKFCGKHS
jgi:predicted transcriptional regulator